MKSLLDHFIPKTEFRLNTTTDLFALRLAQKLKEATAARHYVSLTDTHSVGQLLSAYRRTMKEKTNEDLGKRFHVELERVYGNGHRDTDQNLISIRIERRAVAVAIFRGHQLEYTDARQLSSVSDKALASAVGFVTWILDLFPLDSAALELIPRGQEFRRGLLHDEICKTLRNHGLPIWEVPKALLLEGYGHPPLKSRAELREIATNIWPVLEGTRAQIFIQDAAVLGLHVQTERLFIIN